MEGTISAIASSFFIKRCERVKQEYEKTEQRISMYNEIMNKDKNKILI